MVRSLTSSYNYMLSKIESVKSVKLPTHPVQYISKSVKAKVTWKYKCRLFQLVSLIKYCTFHSSSAREVPSVQSQRSLLRLVSPRLQPETRWLAAWVRTVLLINNFDGLVISRGSSNSTHPANRSVKLRVNGRMYTGKQVWWLRPRCSDTKSCYICQPTCYKGLSMHYDMVF